MAGVEPATVAPLEKGKGTGGDNFSSFKSPSSWASPRARPSSKNEEEWQGPGRLPG